MVCFLLSRLQLISLALLRITVSLFRFSSFRFGTCSSHCKSIVSVLLEASTRSSHSQSLSKLPHAWEYAHYKSPIGSLIGSETSRKIVFSSRAWAISPNHAFLERSKSHAHHDERHRATRHGLPDLISGNLQTRSPVSVTRGVNNNYAPAAEPL
jgi:hypothetical protein